MSEREPINGCLALILYVFVVIPIVIGIIIGVVYAFLWIMDSELGIIKFFVLGILGVLCLLFAAADPRGSQPVTRADIEELREDLQHYHDDDF